MWDLDQRREITEFKRAFEAGSYFAEFCRFSPDGKILAMSGLREAVRTLFLGVDPDSWKRRACYVANRPLAEDECSDELKELGYCNACEELLSSK
jgi:hypothetical protein